MASYYSKEMLICNFSFSEQTYDKFNLLFSLQCYINLNDANEVDHAIIKEHTIISKTQKVLCLSWF